MSNPWDNDPIVSAPQPGGPIYGLPRQPTPQTPAQSQGDVLGNIRTQQQIQAQPLQNANTQTNIEQSRASISNQRFNQNQGLRQEFNALPLVKNYSTVVQTMSGALRAPDNAQGDLAVLYAFAQTMDPNSVVRESESQMAQNTASLFDQLKVKYNMVTEGQRLPPAVRQGLIEASRAKLMGINDIYNQTRHQYADLAKRNGFDPVEIIGPHLADSIRSEQEDYIRAHGGIPRINGVPVDVGLNPEQVTQGGLLGTDRMAGAGEEIRFNDAADERTRAQTYQDQLFSALSTKQLRSQAQVNDWIQRYNEKNGTNFAIDWTKKSTRDAIRAAARGQPFTVGTVPDPAVEKRVQEIQQNQGTSWLKAGARGASDVLLQGLDNKAGAAIEAAGDALSGKGSFRQNYSTYLDADRQYEAGLRQELPYWYMGGQIMGGIAESPFLPGLASARTVPELARAGAVYGGIHGFNSAEGNLADQIQGGITEAAAGAAVPAAFGGLGAGKNYILSGMRGAREIPPLVDSVTGELNQPMDAMRPAERVQMMQNQGLNTITPGMAGGRSARVIEQGFNNLPGSAGLMEDVNAAASKELRGAMQNMAQKFGTSKTLSEGGAELQRGAQERIDRAQGVIGRAYQAIPIADTSQAAKASTVATLQNLTSRFQSNPKLAEAMHDPQLSRYLDAFQSGDISWQDLKQFRTIIGEKIGDMRFGESSSTSDLRALYGALSEDMRATAAAQGPKALRAFERANTLNRENEELIQGSLTRILGKDGQMSPEKAAAAVQAMTRGGKSTGDLKTLAQIRAATIKSGAWDEIVSTLVHLGGQPANSEGRAFNPQTFVQWYADMSEPARRMLFKPELRKSLNDFVATNQQLSRVKGLTNTSNTTPTMIGSGFTGAVGTTAALGFLNPSVWLATLGLVAGAGANNLMARLWTSPIGVRLVTGLVRAQSSGNANAVSSQVGRLQKLATTNPELREPIERLLKSVANENAPSVGSLVASPDQGPQGRAQPQ